MNPRTHEEAQELFGRIKREQQEVERLAPLAVDLSRLDERSPDIGPSSQELAAARRIRKRRRKLGQNGFATRRMAVPK